MLIDVIILARFESNLFDNFANELGNNESILNFKPVGPRFLARDLNRGGKLFWIVRQ